MQLFSDRPRRLLAGGLALTTALGTAILVEAAPAVAGVTFNVTTILDVDPDGSCTNTAITAASNPAYVSLREAICLANNNGGAATINIPAGHYVLSKGELQPGVHSGQNISIAGAGSAATIIDANHASRALEIDKDVVGGITVSIAGVTITNGYDTALGGAGILDGSSYTTPLDQLTIDNSVISSNVAQGIGNVGGGVAMDGGNLTITNSTISGNTAQDQGGGVYYTGHNLPASLTVSSSTFSSNRVTDIKTGAAYDGGGALAVAGTSATQSVTQTQFVNNNVTSSGPELPSGGAIFQNSGTLTVSQSNFAGNSLTGTGGVGAAVYTTGSGDALHYNRFFSNAGISAVSNTDTTSGSTTDAADNWWGCNTGPGTIYCDGVSGNGSTTTVTTPSYLKLVATASPAHVVGPNGSATISASLTTDSLGATVSGTDLGAFETLPVTFADPPGDATVTTTSGSHAIAITAGNASVDYHSNTTVGPDNDTVSFDNATVTAVLEVDEAPAITSANTANFDVGSFGSFTVTTTGYPTSAITESGALPAGMTFADQGNGTATISGTPTSGGTYPLDLTADNGYSPNGTQTLTLTVGQPPAFTSSATATFRVGSSGSFPVTTSGIPTVSSIVESGTLPAGITFTDNSDGTATLSGTPTGPGNSFPVTLTATNGISPDATQNLTIVVQQGTAVTGDPADQTAQPGDLVTFTAAASGYPTPTVQWQKSTDGGGTFTDIPAATSPSYTFTAALADDQSQYRAVFTNVVNSATTTAATLRVGSAPSFTSANHTDFVAGGPNTFTVAVTGVPDATITETGAMPASMSFHDNGDNTATLSGTPTVGEAGPYTITLNASNGFSPDAQQTFTFEVDTWPTITGADQTTFKVGQPNTFTVTTTPGYPTTTTVAENGALPAGVTFVDNGDGTATLTGIPAAGTGGIYPITIVATASGGAYAFQSRPFTLTVTEPPHFTSADHTSFTAGSPGSFTVTTAAGYPTATTITAVNGLPSGVTFTDNGNGTATLAGTPAAGTGGVYSLFLTASNGTSPGASQWFTLTVNEAPHITSADNATFRQGDPASSFTVTTRPGQPLTTTLTRTGSLPPGMTFTDNGDGTATLAGTPTAHGTYAFTITASNGVLPDDVQSFTATVQAPPAITSANHSTFTVGSAGTFTVTTTSGTPGQTTLTESGTLPDGVTFIDNGDGTATLGGTPAVGEGAVYSLTISAGNGVSPDATQSFTLTVNEPPHITSADHVTFRQGDASSFAVTTAAGLPTTTTMSESGALPAGVTFTDNGDGTATLAGTPTANGTYPLTITASNGVLPNDSQSFTLTVQAPPTITSTDHTTFTVGTAGSFTVTTAAGTPPSTTLAESGTLPAGVTFADNGDGTATLAGTPAAGTGGLHEFTITAVNGVTPDPTQSFTLTVHEAPAFTSADHDGATIGTPVSFTVTTTGYPAPAVTRAGDLPTGVTFTDNGDGTATFAGTPAAGSAGSYPLRLSADNSIGTAAAQAFTLTVSKIAQTITVTSDSPASGVVDGSYTPTATSDSGLPVAITVDGTATSVCSFDGTVVHFDHQGTCLVDFDQAGDGSYYPAAQQQQSVTVNTIATTTTVAPSVAQPQYGQQWQATATVKAPGRVPAGTVQFQVDGVDAGAPVALVNGEATSGDLVDATAPLRAGLHEVSVTFTPDDPSSLAGSQGSATVAIAQAATTTTVRVLPSSIAAAVDAVPPGAGRPTGTVQFLMGGHQIGTAPVVDGVATLAHRVPAGATRVIGAIYSGDADFTGSSDSTARKDPRITATVTSAHARTRSGWYRSAVTVRFYCVTNGAPLTGACPAPVVLRRNGAGQSVTRTISATDGGMSTVAVRGIAVDQVAPRARVAGVRSGAVYPEAAPSAGCVGNDAISGVATCRLSRRVVHGVTYVSARATDRAGNVTVATVHFRVLGTYLQGARYDRGAFDVRVGHAYTLITHAAHRPRYYDAAVSPRRPRRADNLFHRAGAGRWAIGVRVDRGMRSHPLWNVGIKIGDRMYVIRIRVL